MTWVEPRRRTDRKTGRSYVVYRVRWRDDQGRPQSKTLPRGTSKRQAHEYAHRVALAKATGGLSDLDAGRDTLDTFIDHWWETYAVPNLKDSTLERYGQVLSKHIAPHAIVGLQLRELRPQALAGFRRDLERAGVGAATIRKAFVVLQSMLARAVEEGRIQSNPAQVVRKPPARRKRDVVVIPPVTVERICRNLIERDREGRGHRDATVVRLLAYSGVRPWSEGAQLSWERVRRDTIRAYATKTERGRSIDLLPSLRRDLAEWKLASGHAGDGDLVLPGSSGGEWTDSDVRNWRRRVWKPALKSVNESERKTAKREGRQPRLIDERMVPYELRHCFASLLLRDPDYTLVEVAEQLGHSVAVLSSTYAHVIDDLKGQPPIKADEQIRRAKAQVWGEGKVIGL